MSPLTDSFLLLPLDIPTTHSLGVRFLPNIRRKDHRDIDGSLGISALRFGDALCRESVGKFRR